MGGIESKIKVPKKIAEEIFETKASSLKDIEVPEIVEDGLSFYVRFFSLNLFQKHLQLINVHCAIFWVLIKHHLHIFWCLCYICPESSPETEADPKTVLIHSLQWHQSRHTKSALSLCPFLLFSCLSYMYLWKKEREKEGERVASLSLPKEWRPAKVGIHLHRKRFLS